MFTTKIASQFLSAKTMADLKSKFIKARDYETVVMGAAGASDLGCQFDVMANGETVGHFSFNGKFWSK